MGQQEGEELMQEQESDAEEGVHGAHYAASWMERERHRRRNIRTVLYESRLFNHATKDSEGFSTDL